jgi:hypothetical protein
VSAGIFVRRPGPGTAGAPEQLSRRARATTVLLRDRRRAEIIVLSVQALTQQRIAEQLGISRVTGAPQRRYEIAPGTEGIAFGNAADCGRYRRPGRGIFMTIPSSVCSNRFSRWSSRSTSLAWSESDYVSPLAVGWDREGSNPAPSSGESANFWSLSGGRYPIWAWWPGSPPTQQAAEMIRGAEEGILFLIARAQVNLALQAQGRAGRASA